MEKEEVLVLSVGGTAEPLTFSINEFKPDLVCFLHTSKTLETCEIVLNETNFNREKVIYLEIPDSENLDDSFVKSKELFETLKDEKYDVRVDFTGGTKPMVSGIVLAVIEGNYDNFRLNYVGEKDSVSRTKNGVGVVKDGGELNKLQINPYKKYAIKEFKRGRIFFNSHQFVAARKNFEEAKDKLDDENLMKLAEIYERIVIFYDYWDKFNNKIDDDYLNDYLRDILIDIKNDDYIFNHFQNEYPSFYKQLKRNYSFLNLKISKEKKEMDKKIAYYLPDLLNNAQRRIDEGKYDDAVARLYRCIELVAQLSLHKYGCIDKHNLRVNKSFFINKTSLLTKINPHQITLIDEWNSKLLKTGRNRRKTFDLDSSKSYKLLNILTQGDEHKFNKKATKIYKNYKDEVKGEIKVRNSSILAHGLNPIDGDLANDLYDLVLGHSNILYNTSKYIEFSKFPEFKE